MARSSEHDIHSDDSSTNTSMPNSAATSPEPFTNPTLPSMGDKPTPLTKDGKAPGVSHVPFSASSLTKLILQKPLESSPILLLVGQCSSSTPNTLCSFYVHTDLLTHISPFFRAALANWNPDEENGTGFLEAQSRTVRLPEERGDDVRYLLQWVYANAASRLVCERKPPQPSSSVLSNSDKGFYCPTTFLTSRSFSLWHHYIDPRLKLYKDPKTPVPAHHRPAFGPLIRLYLLADRLSIDVTCGLRDQILDRILDISTQTNCVPGADDVRKIWDNTLFLDLSGNPDPLRCLVLDLYRGLRTRALIFNEMYATTESPVTTTETPSDSGSNKKEDTKAQADNNNDDDDEGPASGYPPEFLTGLLLDFMEEVNPRTAAADAFAGADQSPKPHHRHSNNNKAQKDTATSTTTGPKASGDTANAATANNNNNTGANTAATGSVSMVKIGRLWKNKCDYHGHD